MRILVYFLFYVLLSECHGWKEPRPSVSRFSRRMGNLVHSLIGNSGKLFFGNCISGFRCYNGTCLDVGLTCDGVGDCSGAEDEVASYCGIEPEENFLRIRRSVEDNKVLKETWNRIGMHPESRQAICSNVQFWCPSNYKCISITKVCDGHNDCTQREDEENCPFVTCPDGYERCSGGKCIPFYWICDEIRDCPSGFDETNFDCATRSCKVGQFRCTTGACLPGHFRCDGQFDCQSGEDENICDLDAQCDGNGFLCTDGSACISEMGICDGLSQCTDGSDEFHCEVPLTTAESSSCPVLCKIGSYMHCLPQNKKCDKTVNCWDGSDEEDCPTTANLPTTTTTTPTTTTFCDDGFFICVIGTYSYCLSNSKLCDQEQNCDNGDDEKGCTPPPQSITTTTLPTTTLPTTTLPSTTTIPPTTFVCSDGFFICVVGTYTYCLPNSKLCDQEQNCDNGDDEKGCTPPPQSITTTTLPTTTLPTTTLPTTTLPTTTLPTTTTTIPSTTSVCSDGFFICVIGTYTYCLPNSKLCDQEQNCDNGDDEKGCTPPPQSITTTILPTTTLPTTTLPTTTTTIPPTTSVCSDGFFICVIGTYTYCLPNSKLCDQEQNCDNGDDEKGCTPPPQSITTTTLPTTTLPTTTLPTTTLPTTTTTIPPTTSVCSDGFFICVIGTYTYCLPNSKLCDQVQNCDNGDDEKGCTPPPQSITTTTLPTTTLPTTTLPTTTLPTTTLPTTTLPTTTTTIPPTTSLCSDGFFICVIGTYTYCLPNSKLCDQEQNCDNGDDEKGCTPPPQSITTTTLPTTTLPTTTLPTTTLPTTTTTIPPTTSVCSDGFFICVIGTYTYCLPNSKLCDQEQNCDNGDDEKGCTPPPQSIPPTTTTLPTTTLPTTTLPTTTLPSTTTTPPTTSVCSDGFFICVIGTYTYCLPNSKLCDQEQNCDNGDDEKGCTPPPQSITTTTLPTTTLPTTTLPTTTLPTTTLPTTTTTLSPTTSVCDDGFFICVIGTYTYCLPNSKLCDQEQNCDNGDDEKGCTPPPQSITTTTLPTTTLPTTTLPTTTLPTTTLPTTTTTIPPTTSVCDDGFFICVIGTYTYCLPNSKLCDQEQNCDNGDDERDCPTTLTSIPPTTTVLPTTTLHPTTTAVCGDGFFICLIGTYTYCLPNKKLCDQEQDCDNGDDEKDCPTTPATNPPVTTTLPPTTVLPTTTSVCTDGFFMCVINTFKYCLPNSKKCDLVQNCDNGEDEKGCATTSFPTTMLTSPCGEDIVCRVESFLYCLPQTKRCNGKMDCPDRSDEENCVTTAPSRSTTVTTGSICDFFTCQGNGQCVDMVDICNGVEDCPSGEDEDGCPTPVPCVFGQFECNDGTCIPVSLACDGTAHCPFSEDELNCPQENCPSKFRCKSNDGCLQEIAWCDGVDQCEDGSDEENCGSCGAGQFACSAFGMCIERSKVCDGRPDCPGPTDEEDCTAIEPCVGFFDCQNGYCIDISSVCDDVMDCHNGFDENDCEGKRGESVEDEKDTCQHYWCNNRCLGLTQICEGRLDCGVDLSTSCGFRQNEETDKETLDELLLELSNSLESVKRQKSNTQKMTKKLAKQVADEVSIRLQTQRDDDDQKEKGNNIEKKGDEVSDVRGETPGHLSDVIAKKIEMTQPRGDKETLRRQLNLKNLLEKRFDGK
ncbi:uncharacterized protein [Apostichopus japonicus]|uniref:uncharacterized protein isoform X2 n=1 Tax=Stichopus japonicus TaxID=307972 RepID=UPI003AB8F028